MNRLTLLTICLLAWTANVGFCQDQPLTDAAEPQQAPSQAETNQPSKSESAELADTLFKGEWKLNSAELIYNGIQTKMDDIRYPKPKSGWIKDGAVNLDGENIEYEVVTLGRSKAIIRPVSNLPSADTIEIKRTPYLLILTVSFHQTETSQPPNPREPARPEGIVLEFWRVDPNRKAIVERMELLSNLMTELETSGDSKELAKTWQELEAATAALKRMDTAPEIPSLRHEILQVRKSGDHKRADQMERTLAQTFPEVTLETKTEGSDSSAQQALQKQINATTLKLDQFKQTLGAKHPRVIEAKRKLASLQSLFDQNATASSTSQRPLESRTQLEQTRDQLLIKYAGAEQRARDIAAAQKPADDEERTFADKVTMNKQRLTQAVQTAFDLQQQLQDVRLQLAELDLRDLRAKYEYRTSLAYKIIERRVKKLQQENSPSAPSAEDENSQVNQLTKTVGRLYPELKIQAYEIEGSILLRGTASQQQIKEIVTISEQFFPVVISQLQPDVLGTPVVESQSMATPPTVATIEVPAARREMAIYTKLDEFDVVSIYVNAAEGRPLTKSEFIGKYLNQKIGKRQRITREMLVENPTTEQIVEARLKIAAEGKDVFCVARLASRTFPESIQSVQDSPYRFEPNRVYSELPEWTSAFIEVVARKLSETPKVSWSDAEFRLLWSLEPLVFFATDTAPYDLQPLARLFNDKLYPEADELSPAPSVSDRWYSALVCGITARLNVEFTNQLFQHPLPETSQTQLLKTMCANKADFTWIRQEQSRLAGLLQKDPLWAVTTVLQGNWRRSSSVSSWLYAMSTDEQYEESRFVKNGNRRPTVDPFLVVLAMKHVVGESSETDMNIVWFLQEKSPGQAFGKHLDALLGSRFSHRDLVIDALAEVYGQIKKPELRAIIARVAPGAAVQEKQRLAQ